MRYILYIGIVIAIQVIAFLLMRYKIYERPISSEKSVNVCAVWFFISLFAFMCFLGAWNVRMIITLNAFCVVVGHGTLTKKYNTDNEAFLSDVMKSTKELSVQYEREALNRLDHSCSYSTLPDANESPYPACRDVFEMYRRLVDAHKLIQDCMYNVLWTRLIHNNTRGLSEGDKMQYDDLCLKTILRLEPDVYWLIRDYKKLDKQGEEYIEEQMSIAKTNTYINAKQQIPAGPAQNLIRIFNQADEKSKTYIMQVAYDIQGEINKKNGGNET